MFNSVECALPENETTPGNENEAEDVEFHLMVDELFDQLSSKNKEKYEFNVNTDLLKVLAGYIAYRVHKKKH